MKDINNMAIEDVDPELTIASMELIGLDCYEKSNDETLSYQDRVKYFMVAVRVKEFLEAIISLDE